MELRVGVKRHACFAYVAKSETRSKQKRVIQSDQDVQVCANCFWWRVDKLLCMILLSSLFSLDVDYLSLFLCLVSMWHTFFGYESFISLFCVYPTSLMVTWERERERESWCDLESYFVVGGSACYLLV